VGCQALALRYVRRTIDESRCCRKLDLLGSRRNGPQSPAKTPRDPSCTAEATTKKLAGAAKTSFMKKCQTDSATACDAAAADKKLNGAAKTSFTKKCVTDSVGS
jgi:hypothetical protein